MTSLHRLLPVLAIAMAAGGPCTSMKGPASVGIEPLLQIE